MSVTTAELAYCMTLPPKRAVSYLKSKGYQITWDWEEMWQEAHARAFTVAKVTRLDILEDIRGALQQAVDEGKTDRWFRQELEPVLKRKGWWGPRDTTDPVTGKPVTIQQGSPWRLDTIFRTNMSVLYSAGRWAEQMENVDDRPYWMYTGINDSHTRRSHLALHGLVLRWDDPFWQAFYPPNGWRCRCSVIALSATDVRARGLKVISSGSAMGQELKLVSEKTGEMRNVATFNTGTTKVTTDVGWSYAPGGSIPSRPGPLSGYASATGTTGTERITMASDNLVSITINDKSLRRSLRALDLAATDMEPAMRKIAGTLLAETQFNFLDEGRPGWMPSLAAEERDGQTLQDTGRLMGSVSTDHDDRQAVVGTNVVYGAIHQFGGKTGRNESVELPARPFLPVTGDGELQPEVVIPILDTIVRHLESAARR